MVSGGGIYNHGTLMLNNGKLLGYCGGIYNAGGTVTISNSTIAGIRAGLASMARGSLYRTALLRAICRQTVPAVSHLATT